MVNFSCVINSSNDFGISTDFPVACSTESGNFTGCAVSKKKPFPPFSAKYFSKATKATAP